MNKPNILWITVDACRKDMFYKLPYIQKLAKKSIVFENAFANAPWTLPSVASMFTGLYPSQHGALNEKTKLKKNVKTIAEILREKRYETIIITQNDGWITPFYGLTRGFKKIYDIEKLIEETLKLNFQKRKKLRRLIRVFTKYFVGYSTLTIKLLKNLIRDTKEPWFIYLHLMDTHLPYEPRTFPIFAIFRYLVFYKNWKGKRQKTWVGEKGFSNKELKMLKRYYIRAMKDAEKQIKKFISILDERKTVVLITADHGENLGENGIVGHQFSVSDNLLNVPLIVLTPSKDCGKVHALFETKNLFHFIDDVTSGNSINFRKSDYVFGENSVVVKVYNKLKKIKGDLSYPEKFIRTKKAKYVVFNNGKERIYRIENKKEIPSKNKEALSNMRLLMRVKEKNLKKKVFLEIGDTR